MKVERNRAWRRRKARLVLANVTAGKNWLFDKLKGRKLPKALKPHRHGALTAAQGQRQWWAVNQELHDANLPAG